MVRNNTLTGTHMGFGFIVSGVEDWTVIDNVDLSTRKPYLETDDCFEHPSDRPAGFQFNERTTSATYMEFLPLLNSGAVVLLDARALLRELRGLERRRGTAGRDRVDHPGGRPRRPGCGVDRSARARRRPTTRVARFVVRRTL